jgi:hypothetical protein
MKIKSLLSFAFIITLILSFENLAVENFYAYYAAYSGSDDITGPYADIVVQLGENEQVIFNRESSYLPFFKTNEKKIYFNEAIKRSGEGTGKRPDADNKYSYVRIIKNSPEEILVHWRYIPDFHNLGFSGVVHEYFYFYPDGKVRREIREGKDNLIDYNDPQNKTVQELKLSQNGIKQLFFKAASLSKADIPKVDGNPVKSYSEKKPDFWLKFDEGINSRSYNQKDSTFDYISGKSSTVQGNITLYKKGVSGTALAFDGYYSKVVIPQGQLPEMEDGFTIDAWVALGAYPWRWAPIVDIVSSVQLYFGINDIGQLGFKYIQGPDTLTLDSDEELPLNKWSNVAVSIYPSYRKASIFINGKKVKESPFEFEEVEIPILDTFVGLNRIPMTTTFHVSRDYPPYVRTPEGNQPMIFGVEGLIDELQIFSSPLSGDEVLAVYNLLKPSDEIINNPDLEKRVLPGQVDGNNASKFGAYYTKLKYHDLWDNLWRTSDYPDVVVRFDDLPTSVVYWRGPNYGPGWVTEKNIWMCDQSSEIYDYYGCSEHMADKQNRYSNVRIIENNPARVVIHWRYAATDITYALQNRKVWSDEYHYIYPDGTAIRYVTYHDKDKPGWQDVQFFSPAGETPEDQINLQALTVANLNGDIGKMDWTNGIPKNNIDGAVISVVNFKSKYKVMVIYPEDQIEGIGAWGENERLDKSKTHFAGPWNHWPVSQMPNDGRYAPRLDRVTHSALGGGGPHDFALYGFTNKDIKELIPLGRFFNNAPSIEVIKDAADAGFVQHEKAYHINASGPSVELNINASEESPLVNPAFVIKNWNDKNAEVKINRKELKQGKGLRIGYNHTSKGIDLVVWIKMESQNPVKFEFNKAKE